MQKSTVFDQIFVIWGSILGSGGTQNVLQNLTFSAIGPRDGPRLRQDLKKYDFRVDLGAPRAQNEPQNQEKLVQDRIFLHSFFHCFFEHLFYHIFLPFGVPRTSKMWPKHFTVVQNRRYNLFLKNPFFCKNCTQNSPQNDPQTIPNLEKYGQNTFRKPTQKTHKFSNVSGTPQISRPGKMEGILPHFGALQTTTRSSRSTNNYRKQ